MRESHILILRDIQNMQENIYQGFQFYFPWSHFKGNLHFNDTRGIHYFLYMSFEFGDCSHFHYSTNQLGAKNLKKMKLLWCTLAYDCCTSKAKLMFFETWQNLLPLRKANLCFLYRVKYRTLKITGSYLDIDVDYTTQGFSLPCPTRHIPVRQFFYSVSIVSSANHYSNDLRSSLSLLS